MSEGFCVHCGRPVPRDPLRPLCFDCWVVSAATEDPVAGRFCHGCGRPEATSLEKPLCDPCYLGAHLQE